jgi:hypothetical protein
MNIKDYLHLYLGCQIELKDGIIEKLKCVDCEVTLVNMGWGNAQEIETVKPILRPLSSMTAYEYGKYNAKNEDGEVGQEFVGSEDETSTAFVYFSDMAVAINQLRKDGFDCDGLIEAGLAIDATKMLNKV